VGTGIFFGYHYHRCQDFCSLHGFRLTLEANRVPSFGSVPRTSPLRGPGWWPPGVAWLGMSFLSR
jgi:hypothetical protein